MPRKSNMRRLRDLHESPSNMTPEGYIDSSPQLSWSAGYLTDEQRRQLSQQNSGILPAEYHFAEDTMGELPEGWSEQDDQESE